MKKKSWLLIYAVICLGIFLRVYNIGQNYYFSGELGKELLYMRKFALDNMLPLTGMATSHEWLNYGPFYYWIMIPVFNLFKGNPFILFWSSLTVAAIGLILNFAVVRKIAGAAVATVSTIMMAVSPLFIWQTGLSKLHAFFYILSPLFMYALFQIWNGKNLPAGGRGKWILPAGLIFGLMFSFHFSQIPLLAVVALLFYLKKNLYKFRDWAIFGLGALIPNLTLVWQDKSLAVWLPYRILNVATKDPAGTLQSFSEYFGRNVFWKSSLWGLGLIIFLAVFGHYVYSNRKRWVKEFLPFYLTSSIGIVFIANLLHGAPPVHYFLPIFTAIPILYSLYLVKLKRGIFLIIFVFLINLGGYFSFIKPIDYVPYVKQAAVADFIVSNAKGKPLSVRRIGPYDFFPESYSQNYKYLILWKGGKLVENSANVYTITEKGNDVYVQK